MNKSPIILASGSAIRAAILREHGVDFEIVKPGVDESEIKIEAAAEGLDIAATALRLAEAKCMAVAKDRSGFVIGSDQILEFNGAAYDKPADFEDARRRIRELQGKTHTLVNATVLASDGGVIWRNVERPRLTMRPMSDAEVDAYIAAADASILQSVGAYQIETTIGADLFQSIHGDRYAVLGLAVRPLLDALRCAGAFGENAVNLEPVMAGVVGSPVSHSLSPLIHNSWAKRAFIPGEYRAIEVPPDYDAFAAAMDRLRNAGFAGVNVTIPHKEHALRYAQRASDAALAIGAANMITFTSEGAEADNSDAEGFLTSLSPYLLADNPLKVLIIGAGGAARAVAYAVGSLATDDRDVEIVITNRTRERAEAIAADMNARVLPWENREDGLKDVSLLVNTTSLGMTNQPPLELSLEEFRPEAIVYDLIYAPLETELLRKARARGNPVVNGLEMLMAQAQPGFARWFGAHAPYRVRGDVDDDLRAMLVRELEKRGEA